LRKGNPANQDISGNDPQLGISVQRITPWTEIIGLVEEIKGDYITLRCSRRVRVPIPLIKLDPLWELIEEGAEIAVLTLDDGRVRIRLIDK